MCWYSDTRYATLHSYQSATIHPVLCSVCPVLCPVVPVFDEFALAGFLFIQVLTERQNPPFSIVIPVVVGSNPISHPIRSAMTAIPVARRRLHRTTERLGRR